MPWLTTASRVALVKLAHFKPLFLYRHRIQKPLHLLGIKTGASAMKSYSSTSHYGILAIVAITAMP
jgi:fumarate reductase subunit D